MGERLWYSVVWGGLRTAAVERTPGLFAPLKVVEGGVRQWKGVALSSNTARWGWSGMGQTLFP